MFRALDEIKSQLKQNKTKIRVELQKTVKDENKQTKKTLVKNKPRCLTFRGYISRAIDEIFR